MCEKCLYRKNCQFLAKRKSCKVEGCTAFKSEKELIADTIRKMQERLCEGRVSNDPVVIATNVVVKEMLGE